MRSIGFFLYIVGAMAAATLLACRQSGPAEVDMHMARRNAELDRLSWQAGNAGLPPVRILIPVGGHDGDPPVGARRASRAPRMARLPGPPGHRPRVDAAPPRPGHGRGNSGQAWGAGAGGTSGDDLAAAAPFPVEQDLPRTWLTLAWGSREEGPQQAPAAAHGPVDPFLPGSQPDD